MVCYDQTRIQPSKNEVTATRKSAKGESPYDLSSLYLMIIIEYTYNGNVYKIYRHGQSCRASTNPDECDVTSLLGLWACLSCPQWWIRAWLWQTMQYYVWNRDALVVVYVTPRTYCVTARVTRRLSLSPQVLSKDAWERSQIVI